MMKDWFGPHDPGDPMNGSLKYSDVVLDHYRNPRNVGEVPGTAAVALSAWPTYAFTRTG